MSGSLSKGGTVKSSVHKWMPKTFIATKKGWRKTLAKTTGEPTDAQSVQLAMLYDAIGDPIKAEKWYGLAADRAYKNGQLEHAAQLYAASLERMRRLWQTNPGTPDALKRGFKMLARMLSAMTFCSPKSIDASYSFLEDEGATHAPLNAAQVCWQKARGHQLKSRNEDALRLLDRADELMTQAPLLPDLYVRIQVQRAGTRKNKDTWKKPSWHCRRPTTLLKSTHSTVAICCGNTKIKKGASSSVSNNF